MCDRGHAWHGVRVPGGACGSGACMVGGGMCARGHVWQEVHGKGNVW